MRTNWKQEEEQTQNLFWPTVADMAIATCIILVVFWISQVALLETEKETSGDFKDRLEQLERENKELKKQLKDSKLRPEVIREKLARLEQLEIDLPVLREKLGAKDRQIAKLQSDLADKKKEIKGFKVALGLKAEQLEKLLVSLNDPPIILIKDEGKYRFDSGKSEINVKYRGGLNSKQFPALKDEIIKRERAAAKPIDTLEIIGHTDGAPLTAKGNLDRKLPAVLAGILDAVDELRPGSNNDLGLLRALAVKREWNLYTKALINPKERKLLSLVDVRCYSAGQTILPDPKIKPTKEAFTRKDSSARRIEMRMTTLKRDE